MTGNSDKDDDSDCSSSSGDEGYESPPMSDDDDSDKEETNNTTTAVGGKRKKASDDLFGYEPQKFHKQSDNGNLPPPPSSSTTKHRKSAKRNKTVETKILLLERKRQARLRQKAKRDHDLLGDSSDEDSDLELFGLGASNIQSKGNEERNIDSKKNIQLPTDNTNGRSNNKTPPRSAVNTKAIELLSSGDSSPDSISLPSKTTGTPATATTAATRQPFSSSKATPHIPRVSRAAAATTKTQVMSCLSSDDDSDVEDLTSMPPRRPANLPPALAASLLKIQQAKARLEQAQEYHAHDIHVAVQETVYVPTAPLVHKPAPSHANPMTKLDMGVVLEFTCRCGHVVINGIKEPTAKEKQSTVLTVREKEPLSSLVDKFCRAHSLPRQAATITMTFDGRKLDITKTPVFYEMEHEDLIDVSASAPRRSTAAELQQRTARPFANSASTKPTTLLGPPRSGSLGRLLQFSCRTQIKVAANPPSPNKGARRPKRQKQQQEPPPSKPKMITKTVGLCENDRLGVLAKRLCAMLGGLPLSTTKVVMRFDGCVLDQEKSPTYYEMEDEDMIEVSIEKQEQQTNGSTPPAPTPAPLQHQHRPPVGNDTRILLTLVPQRGERERTISLRPEIREPLSTLINDYKDKLIERIDKSATIGNRSRSNRNKCNNELVFQFRGEVLDLTKTPGDYKMRSLDRIDVFEATSKGVAPVAAGSRATRASSRKSTTTKKVIQV